MAHPTGAAAHGQVPVSLVPVAAAAQRHGALSRGLQRAARCAVLALGMAGAALAQTAAVPAAGGAEAGQRFASVLRLRGEISATTPDGARMRLLREGDRVFVGERVNAGPRSEAVLRTEDAGYVAVRPGAAFLAERYLAEGQPSDTLSLRILVGSVRLITGWLGHSNRAGYRVVTPSATIGIRGTDHEPYVMSAELAGNLAQPAGTYDKVNRGATILDMDGNRLDIAAGRVGFARARGAVVSRSLLTVLLPVLLERVPDFYVGGAFDAELDQLSQNADVESLRQLAQLRSAGGAGAPAAAAPAPPAAAGAAAAGAAASGSTAPPDARAPRGTDSCSANAVARGWLQQFDRAITRRNAQAVLRLFAADARVQATVRAQDGTASTVTLERDAFVQSTIDALAGLTEYRQRRVTSEGWPQSPGACGRIEVRSVVIEQGRQNGLPYRFEATEEYLLERRGGRWLAVRAATKQH